MEDSVKQTAGSDFFSATWNLPRRLPRRPHEERAGSVFRVFFFFGVFPPPPVFFFVFVFCLLLFLSLFSCSSSFFLLFVLVRVCCFFFFFFPSGVVVVVFSLFCFVFFAFLLGRAAPDELLVESKLPSILEAIKHQG